MLHETPQQWDLEKWLVLGNFPPGLSKLVVTEAVSPQPITTQMLQGRLFLVRKREGKRIDREVVGRMVAQIYRHADVGLFFQAFRVRSIAMDFNLPEDDDGLTERDHLLNADLLVLANLSGLTDDEAEYVDRMLAVRALGPSKISIVMNPFDKDVTKKTLEHAIEAYEDRITVL